MSAPIDLAELKAALAGRTKGPIAWEHTGEDSWALGVVDPPIAGEIVEQFDETKHEFVELPVVVAAIAESGVDATAADASAICAALNSIDDLIALAEAAVRLRNAVAAERGAWTEYTRSRDRAAHRAWVDKYDETVVDRNALVALAERFASNGGAR